MLFGAYLCIYLTFLVNSAVAELDVDDLIEESGRFTIEGKVYSPEIYSSNVNWQKDTAISINNGEYNGYLKEDGTFVISNVPSGSYVVEIINPDYMYESVSIFAFHELFIHVTRMCFFLERFEWKSIRKESSELEN